MGNICGKTESDNFSSPGRVLGSAPAPAPTSAAVPKKVGGNGGTGRNLGGPSGGDGDPAAARRKAAEAAESRATSNKPSGKLHVQPAAPPTTRPLDPSSSSKPAGKLQAQLDAQKKQSRNDTLKDASLQKQRERDIREANDARQWN